MSLNNFSSNSKFNQSINITESPVNQNQSKELLSISQCRQGIATKNECQQSYQLNQKSTFQENRVEHYHQRYRQTQNQRICNQLISQLDESVGIKNVWADNFEEELDKISHLLEKFQYCALDTEFPGFVMDLSPEKLYQQAEKEYLKIKSNVDALNLIQVGITLSDENGNSPTPISTWQFNLYFDLEIDLFNTTSIQLLVQAGIDFDKLKQYGIKQKYFAEKITSSGLIINPNIKWICFHGAYDFSYMLRLAMNEDLPQTYQQYLFYLRIFFPSIYDLKLISHEIEHNFLGGSLSRLAETLEITRLGTSHQAGSDSLITHKVFFELRRKFLIQLQKRLCNDEMNGNAQFQELLEKYNMEIYGFDMNYFSTGSHHEANWNNIPQDQDQKYFNHAIEDEIDPSYLQTQSSLSPSDLEKNGEIYDITQSIINITEKDPAEICTMNQNNYGFYQQKQQQQVRNNYYYTQQYSPSLQQVGLTQMQQWNTFSYGNQQPFAGQQQQYASYMAQINQFQPYIPYYNSNI